MLPTVPMIIPNILHARAKVQCSNRPRRAMQARVTPPCADRAPTVQLDTTAPNVRQDAHSSNHNNHALKRLRINDQGLATATYVLTKSL